MSSKNSCVAIYKTHQEAEQAIKDLEKAGFDMKQLSIVGKGYHTEENAIGYYNTDDRVKFWGKQGAFWGGLWGMLFGSAFFGSRALVRWRSADPSSPSLSVVWKAPR